MPNVSTQNARGASNRTGKTGENYKVINGYKTRVLTNEDDKILVFFHDTPVVAFNEKTIELNTGGWRTRSTKVRMNQASQEFELGLRVFQKRNRWFIKYRDEIQPFVSDTHVLNRIAPSQKGGEQNAKLV